MCPDFNLGNIVDAINEARTLEALKTFLINEGLPESEAIKVFNIRNQLPRNKFNSLQELLNLVKSQRLIKWYEKKHLKTCKEDLPVLLIPLRLETRVVNDELRIRIFPDDVSLDSHDDRLTQKEIDAAKSFNETRASNDPIKVADAWRTISNEFGPNRAAYIIKVAGSDDNTDITNAGHQNWMEETKVGPLPDRFRVYLYNAADELAHAPINVNYVLPNLKIIGGESEDGLFDASSRWVEDYETALSSGMAVSVKLDDLSLTDEQQLSRIVVTGIRRQTPKKNQDDLDRLLSSHHYTGGLEFLKQGTPTNNITDEKSGFTSQENHESSYHIEVDEPHGWSINSESFQHNAQHLGRALGFGEQPEVFKHIRGSTRRADDAASAMNTALWPVLGGYYLEEMIPAAVPARHRNDIYDHFIRFVRAGGPLPGLRIGRQPYGILPVTRVSRAQNGNGGWVASNKDEPSRVDFDEGLYELISYFFDYWLDIANTPERVPRIGSSDDPEGELLKILSMQPVSVDIAGRPMLDKGFGLFSMAALRDQMFGPNTPFDHAVTGVRAKAWLARWLEQWQREVDRVLQLLRDITGLPRQRLDDSPILQLIGWWKTIDPGPLTEKDDETPDSYLKSLCAGNQKTKARTLLHDLLNRSVQLESRRGGEKRVQKAICRLGSSTILDFLNNVQDPDKIVSTIPDDPSRPPGPPRAYGVRPSLARRILEARNNLTGKRFTSLDQINEIYGVGEDTYHDILHALQEEFITADIDLLFRQTLDLHSHRLDAWFTSFATKRLESMRKRTPNGVHLGAYGYLEDLDLSGDNHGSSGYIHTPSSTQTAAAAVLYSAFQSHEESTDGKHPFHLNLTSERVNRAMQLIQGVREGQPLGALLGYQFERGLHLRPGILEQYIDDFRAAFPIVANRIVARAEDESTENVAARNVVDGVALARAWRAKNENEETTDLSLLVERLDQVLEGASSGDSGSLQNELDRLLDSTDAVGDTLMFESLYHAISENFEASGAALDAMSGKGPPPEIRSLQTRPAVFSLDYRVIMLLPVAPLNNGDCPRAIAEPTLAKWVSEHMPAFDKISCTYSFRYIDENNEELEPLDINSADEDELKELPGIGASKASQIVTHRQNHGSYRSVYELLEADDIDIGETVFKQIQGRVWCGNSIIGLDNLDISAIDFFYLSSMPLQGEETELEERARRIARNRDAIPLSQRIEINLSKPGNRSGVGLDEASEYARTAYSLLSQTTVLEPTTLVMPAESDSANYRIEDARLLWDRISKVKTALNELFETLENLLGAPPADGIEKEFSVNELKAIDGVLFEISRFGMPGAICPGHEDLGLVARARGVKKEIGKRTDAITINEPDPNSSKAELNHYVRKECIDALKSLLGREFIVLPPFVPTGIEQVRNSMDDPAFLGRADEHRVRLWLQQSAEVNSELERLEDWLLIDGVWKEMLSNSSDVDFRAAQLPYKQGQSWLALSDEERNNQPRDRDALSIVIVGEELNSLVVNDNAHKMAGFVIHQFLDRVPDAEVDTSVGFHYDAPSSQPPQTLLLAVPPQIKRSPGIWTEDKLEAIVRDTIDLAKIRAVDLDALSGIVGENRDDPDMDSSGLGALLPGLFLPADPSRTGPLRNIISEKITDWLGRDGDA